MQETMGSCKAPRRPNVLKKALERQYHVQMAAATLRTPATSAPVPAPAATVVVALEGVPANLE
jgi:hypothetical protein